MPHMKILQANPKFIALVALSSTLLFSSIENSYEIANQATRVAGATIFSSSDTIWSSMSSEFSLDLKEQSAQVQAEIHNLLMDQAKLYSILKAAGPYIYYIKEQVQRRNLPVELALLPVIESEFNPNDRSKKGAAGLWQIIPGTAHELGITVRSGYDGRKSVIDSTKAALAYLNDLGNRYNGDWYLALAAYNWGQGNIDSAKRRMGTDNFWRLHVPHETKVYVPKLLAVAAIVKNPEKYGVTLPPIKNAPYFAEIKVNKAVSLDKVAKSSNTSLDAIHQLNPGYKQTVTPVKKENEATILVPANKVAATKTALSDKIVTSTNV